ncbi:MAG: tetratricopeptide repeat protein [Planctomycetota bacterium]|jgi:tetratricopeptide (TPR) repeat protein
MKKKNVVILLILTNVILVGLVLLFVSLSLPQQEKPAIAPISNKELNHKQQVQEKPKQTTKMQIDSIIEQYDVIKSGRYQQAMEAYKQAIRKEPPYTADSTVRYNYLVLGDYEKEIKLCEEKIRISSYPPDFYTLAWLYAKIGKYEKAIVVSKKTIQLHPRYSKIWHILGWLYAKLGENDKAVDACKNALKLDPDSAWIHYGLGRIYVVLGNPEKAIESYKQAIQLQSDFAEAYLFLGLTYAELGDQKNAIDSYRQAILLDRFYPESHFFLGVAYDESGQYKKAIESFKQANIWYDSKDVYYESKETKMRIHGLGIKPDLANIYCIIGVCHLRLEQPFKASLEFKDSIDFDDNHAGAHYGLALAYVLLDKKDEAFEEYEAVKSLKGEEMAKPLLEIINN